MVGDVRFDVCTFVAGLQYRGIVMLRCDFRHLIGWLWLYGIGFICGFMSGLILQFKFGFRVVIAACAPALIFFRVGHNNANKIISYDLFLLYINKLL